MFFFLLFGRGPRPRPNSKKKNTPPPKQQKKHAPAPSDRFFFFCCLDGWVCYFFAVWEGVVFFFLLFGRGACSFFLLFGPGACSFFCCLGRGRVFFFLLFGRGTGVHSLTRLPGSSLSDPTTKETEQQKKTRVPPRTPAVSMTSNSPCYGGSMFECKKTVKGTQQVPTSC